MKYLFLLGVSVLAVVPAAAHAEEATEDRIVLEQVPRENLITVVATGSDTRLTTSGQSISVIDAAEIARIQGPDIARVIERLPGVTIARSGPLGSQTSLFVRGANSEQVVVVLDGVRMQDVAAPSGGFDLGTLLTGPIGKIELLRGSNSVAWGSDAIGGVLALTSAAVNGLRANAEYGAFDSFSGDSAVGLDGESYALGASGGYASSDGISAFADGTEPDAFRQWHAGLNGRVNLTDAVSASLSGRYADSRINFDGYPAPAYSFADTPEYQTTKQAGGRFDLRYRGDTLALRGGVALSDTRRAYFDPTYGTAPNFETEGRSWRAEFAGWAHLVDGVTVDFGADSEWTRFSTSYDPENTARQAGGFALLGLGLGGLSLSGGARFTDHERFGSQWTLGANGNLDLGGGWRLKASFGEGFKAPTLYQLYGYGGNVALRPETSTAIDAGIELGDRNAGLHAAATVFRRDSHSLIDYRWPSGYFNIGEARAEGFELEAGSTLGARLAVRAAYTYLSATNRVTGKALARRPKHALATSLDWRTPLRDLALGADLRLVGDSFDDAGNFVRIDGHALLTLRAALPVGDNLELYGRIENVTDAAYETVAGYGTPGRAAYGGVRVRW